MNVREATPADAGAVLAVHVAAIRGLGPAAYDREQVAAWAAGREASDYADALDGERPYFVVAEADGAVRAFGSLSLEPPEYLGAPADAEVTAVYVHPSVARRGVGSTVLSTLERRARAEGVRALGLTASLNAVPFYEARGYERVRERHHEFSGGDRPSVAARVVEMRKVLRAAAGGHGRPRTVPAGGEH